MAARSAKVTVNGKEITIWERKVSELKTLIAGTVGSIKDANVTKMENSEAVNFFMGAFEGKLTEIFPELTPADIDDAYPSELEALIKGFVDVNFTGLKAVFVPLWTLAKARFGLK